MILPQVAELFARLADHPALSVIGAEGFHGRWRRRVMGLTPEAAILAEAVLAWQSRRPTLILVASERRAEAVLGPLRWFYAVLTGELEAAVALLPARERLSDPYTHQALEAARALALWEFASGRARVLVVPAGAVPWRLHDAAAYRTLGCEIACGQELERDALIAHLERVGYERQELVESVGQFAVRGGILDVFPSNMERPLRIELVGDTVESLREFDPGTQRSVGLVQKAVLGPMTDRWLEASRTKEGEAGDPSENLPSGSVFDLAPETVVVLEEPEEFGQALERSYQRMQGLQQLGDDGVTPRRETGPVLPLEECHQRLAAHPVVELARLDVGSPAAVGVRSIPTVGYRGNVAAFTAEVRNRIAAGEKVLVGAATLGDVARLIDFCREYELPFQLGELDPEGELTRMAGDAPTWAGAAVILVRMPLPHGFSLPELGLTVYGAADVFDTELQRRRRSAVAFTGAAVDLKPGDLVVHVDYGIAEFEGLRQIEADGVPTEFMVLRYADARVYVPLARMDLVQKYRAVGQVRPALDRLSGGNWVARKARARRSVDDLARRLLQLYAQRQALPGYAFPADTPWERELEESFEYEETPDQLRAIEDVKRDLEAPRPMDRLLCGDAGYGKTEVAIRAAFKVVLANKQVAVLAPTTVLAFQHYETFRRRLAAFPVRIEMLSRLRSRAEQKRILEQLATGQVDIVIGTHRLLSRDVRFHDLGLLVVDEEQRFGVAHKERLKELRQSVDVLTMTATPLPRTLHMALLGLRDLSVIETPPRGRMAIETVVVPFSETLIRTAIERELERGGQVFYVHNRIETIAETAAMVQRLVPQARVVIAHGRMTEQELEQVMLRFIRYEADVLVTTTIIENGLDIPRANTLIVDRADRFGLAELYQLRGRVGRSDRPAYAFLLVPPADRLSGEARQRLAALKEFSELGAGFRIAALDLELRGAGNLLGREQHGHINAVGFELYCRMLEQAVAELRGQAPPPERRVTLHLGMDIRIPPEYLPGEQARLQCYRRIADIRTETEAEALRRELEDRFGPVPAPVLHLLEYVQLKALCEAMGVQAVERRDHRLALRFDPATSVAPERLVRLARRRRGARLEPGGTLWLPWSPDQGTPAAVARAALLELQQTD
jgi:transcription-repair coupling factor (superfamily II helicase)